MSRLPLADLETSSADYAARFSGAAGKWLLDVQSRLFIEQLSSVWIDSDQRIKLLDVGGGHAQIFRALHHGGMLSRCAVTVIGSSPDSVGQLQPFVNSGQCVFEVGDLLRLPYADSSFDVVTSFRFLPHCEQWRQHLLELCRVARQAVIVDYPTFQSINFLSPLTFRFKKRFEKNTRTFTLFSHREIDEVFESAGFDVAERSGEFIFPMVIHRMLKNPKISGALELPFGMLNITRHLGSPVILRAVPKGSR